MTSRRTPRPRQQKTAPTAPDTIAVIGAGRLGTALALALSARGYHVTCFVANDKSNARRAARLVARSAPDHPAPISLAAAELDHLPASRIYLFATPDDRLAAAAHGVAAAVSAADHNLKGSVALHTSGALASDVLQPLGELGCACGSLHPLVAVTGDARSGAEALRGSFYCVEGSARAVRFARRIVRSLAGHAFAVRAADKALYHLAAVIASGHAVALFDLACELLRGCGLDAQQARAALLPLVASTTRNLSARLPAQALTGTFARADVATLELHLAALQNADVPDAKEVYRLLGRRAARLAAENGADALALQRIFRLLDES